MITVIDYGGGNLRSVQNALERLDLELGVDYDVSSNPEVIVCASKIIFPGQGAAGQAMQALRARGLIEVIRGLSVPYLGICIGMQVLFDSSEEDETECLGIVSGGLERFRSETLKIPQMGWNTLKFAGNGPLFKAIPDESCFYFVHSYVAGLSEDTVGVSMYGQPFTAMVQKDNFFGTQFHPEKSGEIGLQLIRNFLEL
ncbi:MAG: imidazole glycerol phosphate synthase subunit HisH [Candidatus Peregrinibacteria bacterium]|nr:imidazole glycerol phosphate synthase subunit HisH [Candidatus Peregrinibacteria bacterium]